MSRPLDAHVFWLFGLSGAGKSTLAGLLAKDLRAAGRGVLELDGDQLRAGLCQGLAFSVEDRSENIRRAAEVAQLALQSNLCVVASFITPLEAHRQLVSRIIGPRLSLIHVNAPLEVCRRRDVKGLYAKASAGQLPGLTGVAARFEAPVSPDMALFSGTESIEQCSSRLSEYARQRLTQP